MQPATASSYWATIPLAVVLAAIGAATVLAIAYVADRAGRREARTPRGRAWNESTLPATSWKSPEATDQADSEQALIGLLRTLGYDLSPFDVAMLDHDEFDELWEWVRCERVRRRAADYPVRPEPACLLSARRIG